MGFNLKSKSKEELKKKGSGENTDNAVNIDLLKEQFLKKEYKPLTEEEIQGFRINAYEAVY